MTATVRFVISTFPKTFTPSESRACARAHASLARRWFPRGQRFRRNSRPRHRVHRKKKPFAFVEFLDKRDAEDAKYDWDRRDFHGRTIEVVFAQQKRKFRARLSLPLPRPFPPPLP